MTDTASHVEEVLAFVHDTKTWRDMETEERLEWCRRVALVLDGSTNERFGEWTQQGLAVILGVSATTLRDRITWSRSFSVGDPVAVSPGPRSPNKQAGDARRFFSNPAVAGERKAEVLAEALADDYVAERLVEAIGSDPTLIARYERAKVRTHPVNPRLQPKAGPADPDDWRNWTAAQQEEFDGKTIKSARHLLIANWLRSQGYVASGEAEMLLNIVRPPSDMDSELQDLIAQEGRL